MRSWWLILIMGFVCTGVLAADRVRTMRVVFRDYSILDVSDRPLSAGVILWETKELPDHPGLFASISMVKYGRLRAEAGGCAVMNEKVRRVEIAVLTGLSYELTDRWIVGAWAAPFWNAYGRNPDDAWGIMAGYTWGVK